MADRKNISKYIPADFDPSKLSKRNIKPARAYVNFVCPFRSMRCLACGSFMTKGTKFHNAIKEVSSETYLGCQIIRLHAKCLSCKAAIVIETDPKTTDYRLVSGAKRGYEPWKNKTEANEKTEARLERLEQEETQDEECSLQMLERKIDTAKQEMAVGDALDEIRAANGRRNAIQPSASHIATATEKEKEREELEDAAVAKKAFEKAKRKLPDTEEELDTSLWTVRPSKKIRDHAVLFGLKRKTTK